MILNKLVLYCSRLEQAMLWEVCKKRRCATSNCLFKKIVTHYGSELWSIAPMRISTIADVKDNLEKLTKPIPIMRCPVSAETSFVESAAPVFEVDHNDEGKTELPKPRTTPLVQRKPIATSMSDILRQNIIEQVKNLQ